MDKLGQEQYDDFNKLRAQCEELNRRHKFKLGKAQFNTLWQLICFKNPEAAPVIRQVAPDGQISYEPDPELRDTENIPFAAPDIDPAAHIAQYFAQEVLPHLPDAWIDHDKTKDGCEISFTRYFYEYQAPRSVESITADILTLQQQKEGLLSQILSLTQR